jgi:hypothetical protein
LTAVVEVDVAVDVEPIIDLDVDLPRRSSHGSSTFRQSISGSGERRAR